MSIERTFHCDADDCDTHVRTIDSRPSPAWLTVTGEQRSLHFCSWDCVLKYAAKQPPVETIEFGEQSS